MIYINRVSFRIFVKGGGKRDNCQAMGGGGCEDYIDTSNAFSLSRNIIELIDFLKLGGLGHASQGKFSICETVSGGF